ncbi:hypothetical protein MKW94_022103 [Papaver nudicaule]|uniref:C2 domain-containing protein n=1 Tax=Papaver nudicaule TaxID=74823 RepID=A0AA41VL17_PAPNU|nr:hypothetical protein [Papaver nudicaule]
MSKFPSPEPRQRVSPSSSRQRDLNGTSPMDNPESTTARVAQFVEQLHAKMSSPHEKELITARLLGIARARKDARTVIGSHPQAMPLFVSVLRNGTTVAKLNVAATLSALCKEDSLRLKVLLGGCIPPLLSLLKSESFEARKAAAEAIYEVSSGGLSDDHVGMKIFVTEGVVPTLWEQLNPKIKQDKVVEGFVTGALRNLCGDKDGYWKTSLDAGGVEIIMGLLSSDNITAQSNAASLLARLMLAFPDSIDKVIDAGVVRVLLRLVGRENDISVRVSVADALESFSSISTTGKKSMVDADGIPILIGAVVAPSKEGVQGEGGRLLQGHATRALANICGGMPALILYLGDLSQSPRLSAPVADIIGALAYTLMIFEQESDKEEASFDVTQLEDILMLLLKPRDNKLVQERVLEALASLYGNTHISKWLNHSDAKRVLTGLIITASTDVQEYLILSLTSLCTDGIGVWEALGKKEGIQLLISLLGLSSEQHQEHAVALLAILTNQTDDSKWAITAAGGIPPLVQLLEMGSLKAREDAAHVLWNLCSHSEDIRVCVESAGAVPAFLWLLKSGGFGGQETSARALTKLIRSADAATLNQLLALLYGNSPRSKVHIIRVLGHVLSMASHEDLVHKGAPANKVVKSLVEALESSNKESQESAASVLTNLFDCRQDICDSLGIDETIHPRMKLLTSKTKEDATQSAKGLRTIPQSKVPRSIHSASVMQSSTNINDTHRKYEGDIKSLIKTAKTSSIGSAETAVASLANLLSQPHIAEEALAGDVISALTRVLGEGTSEGKRNAARALHHLLNHFPIDEVLSSNAQRRFVVLALVDSLSSMDLDEPDSVDVLDVVAMLARTKDAVNFSCPPFSVLTEVPSSLEALIRCLAEGLHKAIEILSRLCSDLPVLLGDLLVGRIRCITSLANRIMNSSSLEVRVGGAALLICATKEHKQESMSALNASGFIKPLIYSLVDMMKINSSCASLEIEVKTPRGYIERTFFDEGCDFEVPDPATVLGSTVALWLLSLISSFHKKNILTVMEAGGLEALYDKLTSYTSNPQQNKFEDTEGIWISSLLLSILFQDATVVMSPATTRIIPSLAFLLRSDEIIDRYFSAQAMASLVNSGNKGIHMAIANSDAVAGLISLIGYIESDMPNLVALSQEFSLLRNPDRVVLEHLFDIEDVRVGSIARKSIPLLVDLLRPMPDRPGAPPFAVSLLIRIADENDANKLAIAEAGALDALPKYLSLSPQDSAETTVVELLRILFINPELICHEACISSLNQLIAVLRLGSRSARFSAVRTLHRLFDAQRIRDSESARQAIQPLVDMLDAGGSEKEQQTALLVLIKLTSGNSSNAVALADVEGDPLHSLCKVLLSATSSLELKRDAAQLCFILFSNKKVRATETASECIKPLLLLMQSNTTSAMESGALAFNRLLDDEQQVELAASSYEIVDLLVGLVSSDNHRLTEACISILIKLGKDRTPCKLDMVKARIVENCLELLPNSPGSLCSMVAELFRILTNSSGIARSPGAAKTVEPLFMLLRRPDLDMWGQHSALQALVNILEKPQSLATLRLTPSQVIEPLISCLQSPSQTIQQLGTEALSHLLAQERFQQDITSQNAVVPLVQLAGIGILNLQQTAIKALESISRTWPEVVASAGGIVEISKVIIQDDPQPSHALWESAALVLSNILRFNTEYYFKVPLVVLVRMLHSNVESTITLALNALIIVQEGTDASSSELLAEAGAVDALLDLLRSHQCEEISGKLLEALFNNARVREMKVTKLAIAPLSQYLLDPQTKSQPGKLLAALALEDIFQHEGHARSRDSVSACRALLRLLEDQPTEPMSMVAVSALQNLVMHSRTNKRAVAEAGGILVIRGLLLSSNSEIAAQAALLIKFLFSNHTLQEYVSNDLIRSLTAALDKEFSATSINEEVLRTIKVILSNFPKLHASEAATLVIPHLVVVLKDGTVAAQELVLDILCILRHSWSFIPVDISKAQAMAAAEAIPILQLLMKSCPPSFHERVDTLLHCLPGCLTVTIKRGYNLKQSVGTTNAFCRLTIGNGPPRQTKVVSHSISPEWKEGFTWAFDVPPKGQKLQIICKSKNTFGKSTLGRVTLPIDKVVIDGVHSGVFSLRNDSNKDGSSRTLEIEITWSNRITNEKIRK